MAEYYRTIFTVDGEGQGVALLGEVEEMLREWTQERFDKPLSGYGEWSSKDKQETLRLDGGSLEAEGFFGLSSTLDNGWKLDFGLATRGASVEADVQVQDIADDAESPSDNLRAGPPKMLTDLFKRFDCSFEGEQLEFEPTQISVDGSFSFVHDEIFNPERKLPLVVVTKDWRGDLLVNPHHLQSRLLGLAKVVCYDDKTARRVNDELGKFPCYGGAVRIYMPECSSSSDPWEHKLWLPDTVKELGSSGIWVELRDECMDRSSGLRPKIYPDISRRIRQFERERNRREVEIHKNEVEAYKERLKSSQEEEQTYKQLFESSEDEVHT